MTADDSAGVMSVPVSFEATMSEARNLINRLMFLVELAANGGPTPAPESSVAAECSTDETDSAVA